MEGFFYQGVKPVMGNVDGNSLFSVCWPPFMDVTKPEELGLTGVRNFYLNVDEEITIGAWYAYRSLFTFLFNVELIP